ncbi:MAG TPA: alpha/beta hydrolase [Acidiferrobacterales bacterium]|nr:alpha/beta hydrolase [Acidiferrobacterales bacterium]
MDTLHTLITADGATLAYRRWRAPATTQTLPPLVLLHGAASNLTRWSEFTEQTRLRATRDMLRLDLRGHGQSLYRGRVGLEIWCDDIAAILKQEGYARAILVGHCLGANIAATFAAHYPNMTAGIVLVEPMLRDALTGKLRALHPYLPLLKLAAFVLRAANRLGLYRRHLETLDLRALDQEFRTRLAEPGGGEALVKRYASPLHDLKTMPSTNFLQDLIEVERPLPLEKIHTPFLALLSTGRTFADPDITRALLARLPQGEIHTLESKHWIPTEQPQAMQNAIEAWCNNLTM